MRTVESARFEKKGRNDCDEVCVSLFAYDRLSISKDYSAKVMHKIAS